MPNRNTSDMEYSLFHIKSFLFFCDLRIDSIIKKKEKIFAESINFFMEIFIFAPPEID